MDGESKMVDMPSSSNTDTSVSPAAVYRMSRPIPKRASSCSGADTDSDQCRVRHGFQWHKTDGSVCRSNVLCTVLEGDICKSYGIRYACNQDNNVFI